MIETSAEWDSLSGIAGLESVLVGRLYYGDGTSYVSVCTGKDFSIGSENFLGVVKDIPSILSKIDRKTGGHSISGNPIKIINLEYEPGSRFSDMVETLTSGGVDVGFYNRRVALRIYLPGITTFANCFPLMPNGITRAIDHSREITTIQIEDGSVLSYGDIGEFVTDADAAAAEGGILPAESKGRIKPEIYGNHLYFIGNRTSANYTVNRASNAVPAVYVGVDTVGAHYWICSSHEIEVNPSVGEIWAEDLNRLVELSALDNVQNSSSGCIIKHDTGEEYTDYYFPAGTVSNDNSANGGTITNGERMGDKDNTNNGVANAPSNVAGPLALAQVDVDFPPYENPGTVVITTVYARTAFASGDVSKCAATIDAIDAESPGSEFEAYGNAGAPGDGVIVEITTINSPATPNHTLTVYEMFKGVKYDVPSQHLALRSAVMGRPYGTYINGRSTADNDPKRAGNFTTTHVDDDEEAGADLAIENFAGVIESMARDLAGMVTAQIDELYFNIASTKLPVASYKCASQVTERTPFKEYLADVLLSCRSWAWWQPGGTFKMSVIEDTYAASDLSIDASDFLKIDFDRTPLADIKTAVDVHYFWNGDEYQAQTGISEDTDAQTKYNITEAQSTLIFESKHIADSVTAGKIQTFKKNYLKNAHTELIGTLPRPWLKLDIGDVIDVTNPDFEPFGESITSPPTRAGQTIYKYFKIYSVNRGGEQIEIEAEQLHRLD